jgi:DNA replication protein DnaC
MSMDHHLLDTLKKLKLSGILDTLSQRLAQAREGELDYVEFMGLIFQDEVERRAAQKLQRLIKHARFEDEKTLESFDFKATPKIKGHLVRDLATCRFIERKEHAIICGPTGVGKTHIAQALGHMACRKGHRVLFVKTAKLLRKLHAAKADYSWEKNIRLYLRPELLIIDDFGLQPFTGGQAADLYEIISERCLRASTIVTSNRPVQDWLALFPDPVLAQAAVDRMRQNAHMITIEGDSYRARLIPKKEENKEKTSKSN